MNNEEKILQLLGEMRADLSEVKAEQAEMRADLSEVKAEQVEMKAAMATREDLKQVLAESKILTEGYFEPKFGLLADELKLLQEKMLPMEALDDVEDRLDVLEAVVKRHSREIEKLKKAQ